MRKLLFVCSAAVLFCVTAFATSNRTAVSINGLDTNPCTVASPCRSFGAAIAQTTPGGESVALDSAGYGAFTIDRSITVEAAPGVYAGITSSATSAGKGINIVAGSTDVIAIRGLIVNGAPGIADAGIASYYPVRALYIEHSIVQNFTNTGITLAAGKHFVADTTVRECGSGIAAGTKIFGSANGTAYATIDHCRIFRTGGAVSAASNSSVLIRDTVAASNDIGFGAGFADASESIDMTVENCEVFDTTNTGIQASGIEGGGTVIVRVSNTGVFRSGLYGFVQSSTAELDSFGNNRLAGNLPADTSGTITPISTQ
jgi:hypothetical protein